MRYRELGKTGVKISEISFGASSLGEEYGTIKPAEGERAVHYAIDNEINYFDVAPYYGGTLAEARLGQFLCTLRGRRNEIILATKMGRYKVTGGEKFGFSAERVRSSLEESLRLLRTDYIDIYQAHDIEFTHREQIINETLPAMYQLKKEGKVRFVGITGYPLYLLKDVAEKAEVDTILTYCRYNLMDTSMDEVLTPLAREKGIGLINASPLHMRVLSEKGAPAWHPAPKKVLGAARKATVYCLRRGVNISELAMQFALAHEYVSTTLVGMSKTHNVARNLDMLEVPLKRKLLEEVMNIIKPVANICWEEGIPENFDPGAVPQQS
ncbi:aldo/keto reductase [bacterium]|nr:aldo/keto reductase [bacterium]